MGCSHFPLIRILADGKFHSGEELGLALGLSRAGIWNRIRGVETLGLRVFKIRGRGYRLSEPLDLLDDRKISNALSGHSPRVTIEIVDECASTNTLLAERAAQGAADGSVLVCEHQSAGRGRRGNAWLSRVGGSLTFSLLWRFSQGAGAIAGLSLAVAVGAVRALEASGIAGVQLKWPNDLYLGGRKFGGILIELSGDYLGPSTVIVGIGINVCADADLRDSVGQPITDLASMDAELPSRSELLVALVESLSAAMSEFSRAGLAPFRDEWTRRHIWQGRRVTLSVLNNKIAEGDVIGVAEDGALMLQSARGIEHFHSGEISLRRHSVSA